MKNRFSILLFLLISLELFAQGKPAYKIYNDNGRKISYNAMLRKMQKADIVLFGEHHNNPIVHWLQFEVVKSIIDHRQLTFGAEMFEADNQKALNAYLKGDIDQKGLDTLARLWKNYKTDYKPLVDFAKERNIRFIATNVPRRYASQVFRGGFDVLNNLTPVEKSWLAPLPIPYDPELKGYVNMKTMMGGHGGDNLPKAQAIKDATMAHFILKNLEPGRLFIHFNGSYHSDNYEGINWYLYRNEKQLSIVTISIAEQTSVLKLEEKYLDNADFIIAIPDTMTKTY